MRGGGREGRSKCQVVAGGWESEQGEDWRRRKETREGGPNLKHTTHDTTHDTTHHMTPHMAPHETSHTTHHLTTHTT